MKSDAGLTRSWALARDAAPRPSVGRLRRATQGCAHLRDAALEQVLLLLRRFKPVRERVTIGEYNDDVEREHLARYRLALPYCAGKRVADIACGTGYGTRMLAEVAASAVGYDKESLCGNRIIDLERERWDEQFDVIVSFETIEHLANPEFFLDNARRTTRLLIVSTPLDEYKGYNPHHKQVWTLDEFQATVEKYFRCTYFFQNGERIVDRPAGRMRMVIAVGTPNDDCADAEHPAPSGPSARASERHP